MNLCGEESQGVLSHTFHIPTIWRKTENKWGNTWKQTVKYVDPFNTRILRLLQCWLGSGSQVTVANPLLSKTFRSSNLKYTKYNISFFASTTTWITTQKISLKQELNCKNFMKNCTAINLISNFETINSRFLTRLSFYYFSFIAEV